jgi:protein-arginine deiminase (PAD)
VVVDTIWNTGSKIVANSAGTDAPFYGFYDKQQDNLYLDEGIKPLKVWPNGQEPAKGDNFMLFEDSLMFGETFPAPRAITVAEVLNDSGAVPSTGQFESKVQDIIDSVKKTLSDAAGVDLTFIAVPVIYAGRNALTANFEKPFSEGGAFATLYTPSLTNFQLIGGKYYFPRQFGPKTANGADLFEKMTKASLVDALFVDDWSDYHLGHGEVHCGSLVKRKIPNINWWSP